MNKTKHTNFNTQNILKLCILLWLTSRKLMDPTVTWEKPVEELNPLDAKTSYEYKQVDIISA